MSAIDRPGIAVAALRHFGRNQNLVHAGQAPEAIYQLVDGWAYRYHLLSSGRRQITALFLPGEYCEPQWLLEGRAAQPIVALTKVRARCYPLAEFSANTPAGREHLRTILGAALRLLDWQGNWIATLGRKTALERVCALMSDVFDRSRSNGRVLNDRCAWPLTQADIADIVGLTPVHVNRMLGQLRARGLIELQSRYLWLVNPQKLFEIGSATSTPVGIDDDAARNEVGLA